MAGSFQLLECWEVVKTLGDTAIRANEREGTMESRGDFGNITWKEVLRILGIVAMSYLVVVMLFSIR